MEIDEGLFLPILIFKEVCKKTESQSIFKFCLFCLRNTGFLEAQGTFAQTKKPFAKSIRTYYEFELLPDSFCVENLENRYKGHREDFNNGVYLLRRQ